MQRVHFQVRVGVFNCQQILTEISFVIGIFDIVVKINQNWFIVVKFQWFGIDWHVLNQSECRNCCLYIIIQKIAPQAESGKYFQIWFFPDLGGKMAAFWACACKLSRTSPDSLFARPGSALIRGGKKGEFRDWTIRDSAVVFNWV